MQPHPNQPNTTKDLLKNLIDKKINAMHSNLEHSKLVQNQKLIEYQGGYIAGLLDLAKALEIDTINPYEEA